MTTYEFLETLHREYQPRTYLEVGVNTGASLALSRTRTIAVDPAFNIDSELHCDVQLIRATSDDFFARKDALAHFRGHRLDLAFVDGMHLFEYALRDFMNVERHADWTSIIVIDDVFPRYAARASRERGSLTGWTGDVFKVIEVLGAYRPDLLLISVDTYPTGLLLVLRPDPENGALEAHYDEIVATYVYPDPQRVPEAVLRCDGAVEPASLASSDLWAKLREARESRIPRKQGWEEVRRSFDGAARPAKRRKLTRAHLRLPGSQRKNEQIGIAALPRRAVAATRRRLRPLRRRLGAR